MRLCPCGATITQHMTTTKEVWTCTGCKRREVFPFTKVKKPIKIKMSSVAPQDNHEAIFSCVTLTRELVVQHQNAVESGFSASSTDC